MSLKLLIIYYLFADFRNAFAWLPPERCAQSERSLRTALTPATLNNAKVVPSIEKIVAEHHALLKKTYKSHQFHGVPVRATCHPFDRPVYMYAPYNCTFHTYPPRVLASVTCSDAACKLAHTVSTVDSYTASEGYNWGVKISSKASFFTKMFEVGGEASTGGTYTCTYTKGKTTTDTVECSAAAGRGHLQLYYLKSDMECDFGKIYLEEDLRYGRLSVFSRNDYFTKDEVDDIYDSAATTFEPCAEIMIDPSKISDRLLQKLLKEIPHYNPYTDAVRVFNYHIRVHYFKRTTTVQEYKKVIPFTNEGGDSEFQYACMFTPF